MGKYEYTNEVWWLHLKHQEEEAEGIEAFAAACKETDEFVDKNTINWRVVGELLRDRRGL